MKINYYMTSAPIVQNTNMWSSKNQSSVCAYIFQTMDENNTATSHTTGFQDSLFVSSSTSLNDTKVKRENASHAQEFWI